MRSLTLCSSILVAVLLFADPSTSVAELSAQPRAGLAAPAARTFAQTTAGNAFYWMNADEISNRGEVVGRLGNGTGSWHAFRWKDGVVTLLAEQPDYLSEAVGMNNRGQAVGYAELGNGFRPLLWDNGSEIDLMGSTPGDGLAFAINSRGQVVGLDASGSTYHAFLWQNGTRTDLGPCGTIEGPVSGMFRNFGLLINERGDVLGLDETNRGLFLWRTGQRLKVELPAPVPGADFGNPSMAMNNQGQVVSGAYLWDDGIVTDLGSLGGGGTIAVAINDAGQVAGMSNMATGVPHGFLWEHGHMTDLGLARIEDMNARGQVVGVADGMATLWDNGHVVSLGLPAVAGSLIRQAQINDRGQIVATWPQGCCNDLAATCSLWEHGNLTPLDPGYPAGTQPSALRAAGKAPGSPLPTRFGLEFASSNPSPGGATLRYSLPQGGQVSLRILDVHGRLVRELVSGWVDAGIRTVRWDGMDTSGRLASSGIYFTLLRAGNESRRMRLIHMK
jgi:probable HAF family extracellular repeat protein